jgi:membrane protein implicated in regulation of membrane protease activity
MEIFTQSTQLTIFATILAAGFVYLIGSLIVGSFSDSDGHDADHADGSDAVEGDNSGSAISMFSPRVIAIFLVGFGAGGAIATANEYSALVSTAAAVVCGILIGAGGMLVMRMVYGQQASSNVETADSVGCIGTVTVDIANAECGTIDVSVKGHVLTLSAYAADPTLTFRRGQRVRVSSVSGGCAHVSPVL